MSYKDLLKARPQEIKAPEPIPPGPYKVRVASYEFTKAGQKQNDCIVFTLNLLEPGDEVDPARLAAAEEDRKRAKPKHTIYITEASLWVLKEFLTDVLKIDEKDSLEEMVPETVGKEFIAIFTEQQSQRDASRMVSYINKVLPL